MKHEDYNLEKFISDFERDLLLRIILNLRHKEISLKRAKMLAREFLEILPIEQKEDFMKKMKELGKTYREVMDLYIKYAALYHEDRKQEVIAATQVFLRNGDIDNAISLIKEETYGREN